MRTRNIYGGLVMTAAALLCLAGCKKDEEGEKIMLGTQFEKAASSQKTYLGENNTVCWNTNDSVFVNSKKYYGISSNGIEVDKANNDNYYAVYPATAGNSVGESGGTVVIPATQIYHTENGKQVIDGPMAARLNASSGILYFKNLYSLLKVTVAADDKNFTVNSITVTATGETPALAGTQSFKFKGATNTVENLELKDLTNSSTTVTLNCGSTTVNANTDQDFYLVVHPMAEQNLKVKVYGTLEGKAVTYIYSTGNARTLNRSCIGGLAVNLQQLQPKELEFSVSADYQVEFSPGNLQYNLQTGNWRFAPNQWDVLEERNVIIGDKYATYKNNNTNDGWMGLFGWGTSGCDSKCLPYETSQTNTNYGDGTKDIAGTTYDWGKYNDIYNPKTKSMDAAGTWRTPSNDEWKYLLNIDGNSGRTDANRFAKVKVNNVNGLLIFPDGYTLLSGYTADGGTGMAMVNDPKAKWPTESIPNSTWIVMEAMGCVFLPAAGYRSKEDVFSVNSHVIYWSSTSSDDPERAYRLNFQYDPDAQNSTSTTWHYTGSRKYGVSVRLVKDVE